MGWLTGDEDEEEEEVGKRDWSQYLKWEFIAVVIAVLYMLIFKGRTGTETIDKAMLYGMCTIAGVTIISLADVAFKHASPKFITGSGHTTINPEAIKTVGNFTIIKGGGIHAGGIHYSGRTDSHVVPTSSLTKVGKCLISTVRTWDANLEELPEDVQRECLQKNYPKPYRLGYADEEQYLELLKSESKGDLTFGDINLNKSSVAQLVQHMREQERTNSFLRTLMRKEGETMEDYIARISRVTERAKGTKFEKILRGIIGGGKEE